MRRPEATGTYTDDEINRLARRDMFSQFESGGASGSGGCGTTRRVPTLRRTRMRMAMAIISCVIYGERIPSERSPTNFPRQLVAGERYPQRQVDGESLEFSPGKRANVVVDVLKRAGISSKKEAPVNFLTDPLEGRYTLRPVDILVFGWARGKHAYVDLTGVSPLVGLRDNGFVAGQAALKAESSKVAKHKSTRVLLFLKTCSFVRIVATYCASIDVWVTVYCFIEHQI
ncbi:hypothetical protein Tco_0760832 [Tanacetum coccineum]